MEWSNDLWLKQVWRRGDVVERQNNFGFVVADMDEHDEHLIVRWLSGVEVEEIHRSKIGDIRKFTDSEIYALGFCPLDFSRRTNCTSLTCTWKLATDFLPAAGGIDVASSCR